MRRTLSHSPHYPSILHRLYKKQVWVSSRGHLNLSLFSILYDIDDGGEGRREGHVSPWFAHFNPFT